MTPLLSIIIPTIGRPSLRATLESVRREFPHRAETIVVADGRRPRAGVIIQDFCVTYFETEKTGQWGHAQRNAGMSHATGAYLAFMDDDDIYLPGAGRAIAKAISSRPALKPCVFIFRMRHGKRLIWDDANIRRGNVSTQMMVVPNFKDYIPKWGPDPGNATGSGGDYLWAEQVAGLGGKYYPSYRPEIIAQLTKHGRGKRTPR